MNLMNIPIQSDVISAQYENNCAVCFGESNLTHYKFVGEKRLLYCRDCAVNELKAVRRMLQSGNHRVEKEIESLRHDVTSSGNHIAGALFGS